MHADLTEHARQSRDHHRKSPTASRSRERFSRRPAAVASASLPPAARRFADAGGSSRASSREHEFADRCRLQAASCAGGPMQAEPHAGRLSEERQSSSRGSPSWSTCSLSSSLRTADRRETRQRLKGRRRSRPSFLKPRSPQKPAGTACRTSRRAKSLRRGRAAPPSPRTTPAAAESAASSGRRFVWGPLLIL